MFIKRTIRITSRGFHLKVSYAVNACLPFASSALISLCVLMEGGGLHATLVSTTHMGLTQITHKAEKVVSTPFGLGTNTWNTSSALMLVSRHDGYH